MKQLLSITLFFSLTILLTASSCKKQNSGSQLPPETHTGANTLGFKINGKVYTASGKGGLLSDSHVSYSIIDDTSIMIIASKANDFYIRMRAKFSGGTTLLGKHQIRSYPYDGFFLDQSNGTIPGSDNNFSTSDLYTGEITITYFNGSIIPLNGGTILSGRFEINAINGNGKIIKFTDGRFDINC